MRPCFRFDDRIGRANAQFWNPPSLEELMADVAPLEADEHFDIPDLTDEEWDFVCDGARRVIAPVLVDTNVFTAVAQLRNECRQIGHGMHQRGHNADLWIAATAIRWDIPLVAHDAVFDGCPGLELRTELDTRPAD
jgi:hypothetical protein